LLSFEQEIMPLRYLKYFFLVIISLSLLSCGLQSRLKKADRKFANGAFYDASEAYRKVKKQIPRSKPMIRADVNYKLGECFYALCRMPMAVDAYKAALGSKPNDSIAAIITLRLAKAYHAQGNYRDAISYYTAFLKNDSTHREALAGLAGALNATETLKLPTHYIVKPAGDFNVRNSSDMSPAFVGKNGDALIFTTNRANSTSRKASGITGIPHFDLFTSHKTNAGKWEKPAELKGSFNTNDDEGTPSLPADGRTLYFTRCRAEAGETRGGEIYVSSRSGGEWTPPEQVKLFADSAVTVAHPAISPDGNTLYFVSDAPNGLGGKDIWMVEKIEEQWGIPENLGDAINTSGNEMFPCLRDNKTLYFSSNGHQGLGGLDIFMATKDSLGMWRVESLPYPINSSADDFGITFEATGENGYFSSNRNQPRKPVDKIYRFERPEPIYAIEGRVMDENGDPLPDAIIKLVGNDGTSIKQRVKKDGTYRIKITNDVKYAMLATRRGYLNSSDKVATLGLAKSKTFEINFRLPSISRPVTMENVFYDFGQWTLTEASEKELHMLVKLLNDNPNIAIELSAHTDMIGDDESNMLLSQRRAQSVVDFLLVAGTAPDRLTAKGYGESRPVTVDKTLATQYKFLKEGDVLNAEYIMTLPKEQQEITNQINRRTEFRVTKTTYNLY
jgi:peptidoglycan-associated lipoprotein